MWHAYHTPTTVDEVLTLLAEHKSDARLIAGGTDILIDLERKIRTPSILIDITRIPDLDYIRLENDRFRIGPLVTHNHVVASDELVARAYPLARACWEVGAPQIRNRATIAGNLITASPANDSITPLWAMDGAVTLKSLRSERTLTFDEFYLGVRETAMEDDEMMVDISFAALKENERGTFIKLALRRAQAISLVDTAIVLGFDGDTISHAHITFGSVAPTIVSAPAAEKFLIGKPLSDSVINTTGELASAAAHPISDVRGPAEYRSEMMRVTTLRALRAIRDGNERADWPLNAALLWGSGDGRFPTDTPDSSLHVEEGEQTIETTVNGKHYSLRGANDKTLLRMLREDAELTGTKEGCAEGECGACTVFLDGIAVMACMVAAPRAHNADIITIEGLGQEGQLHAVQHAFVIEDAVQCGYCTPGFIMAAAKLLEEHPQPTRYQIEQSISGNLCRCTGYYSIVKAIQKAAEDLGG